MGRTASDSIRAFVSTGRTGRSGNVSADDTSVYSYRMELARRMSWKGKLFFLINGDGGVSMTTTKHQGGVRGAIGNQPRGFIPHSALNRAQIRLDNIEIVDVTADFTRETWKECRHSPNCALDQAVYSEVYYKVVDGKIHHLESQHFLGECLFCTTSLEWDALHEHRNLRRDYYVCGLDRNDDPRRRMFFLAHLPQGVSPTTVDEALDALRPADVPAGSPRQGEWFFTPLAITKPHRMTKDDWRNVLGLPGGDIAITHVKSDHKAREFATMDEGRNATKRHYAPELYRIKWTRNGVSTSYVVARGTIRDEEHDPLVLPDGWHLAVKNLAVEGWRAGGPGGATVD